MEKPKRIRSKKTVKVPLPPLNDGMNTPVPDHNAPAEVSKGEAALYKQAENPLGDPHKI
jgi:hypothetical protein